MAEKEYIERGELINILNAKAEMAIGTPVQVFYSVANMVQKIPTADVVEVVRCKDCEHYKAVVSTCGNCYRTTCIQHTEDFCSYGKRKEETT